MVKPTVIALQNTLQAVWREFLLMRKKDKYSNDKIAVGDAASIAFRIRNRITSISIYIYIIHAGSFELL